MMAAPLMQVAGGVGSCFEFGMLLNGGGSGGARRRRAAALRPVKAAAAEEDIVRLGESGVAVSKLGIGAWSWGNTTYWNDSEWDERRMKEAKAAFDASVDNGMTFFDTAEVYGTALMGAVNSESLLGEYVAGRFNSSPRSPINDSINKMCNPMNIKKK